MCVCMCVCVYAQAGTQEAMLMSPPAKTPAAPRFPAHLAAYADPTGHIGTAPDIYNPVPLVTPNANLYTPRGLKTPATGFKSGLTFPGYGPQVCDTHTHTHTHTHMHAPAFHPYAHALCSLRAP